MRTLAEWVAEKWYLMPGVLVAAAGLSVVAAFCGKEGRREVKSFWKEVWKFFRTPVLREMSEELQKRRGKQ